MVVKAQGDALEDSTCRLRFFFTDYDGSHVADSAISTASLVLIAKDGTAITTYADVKTDFLATAQTDTDSQGNTYSYNFEKELSAADNAIINSNNSIQDEVHLATVTVVTTGGITLKENVWIKVVNLKNV